LSLEQFLAGIPWSTVLTGAVGLYALSVAIFLILENRSPQSTFAWLFLLLVFPFGGLIIYVLFGRDRHAFSRQKGLTKQLEGTALARRSAQVLAEQPGNLEALERRCGEYARLAAMLWSTARSPLTHAADFEILQNAIEKYPRLLSDVRAAKQSIHMEYYEWASDPFTEEVKQLLATKVREGLEVRILYDPVGSISMLSPRYVRDMRRAGIQMEPFSPLYQLHTLSYRNHRKIAVIDGVIGYSGGLNMTEKHLTGAKGFTGWRDTHARVAGEVAFILQAVFATTWYNRVGENLFQARYFPEEPDASKGVPIQVVNAGPDSRWEAIRKSYLTMIALARDHVYLQSPFLILDLSLAEAIKTAALAGLDIQIMIAPRGFELSPAYRAGMTYAADVARAGVKVWLYHGMYFHAKTICVDSTICSIGSANMDIRSFSINYETNLVIYDDRVTRELEADFKADLEHCVAFSAEEYERRGRASRFLDSTMRLCSPLL
jgi:cardiolipin synthase